MLFISCILAGWIPCSTIALLFCLLDAISIPHVTNISWYASCYHLLRHDYLLSLIPLRPWLSTSHIFPVHLLSSKFEFFEVHVREAFFKCLAKFIFLLVYSWKVDQCVGVCIYRDQQHLSYYLAVVIWLLQTIILLKRSFVI